MALGASRDGVKVGSAFRVKRVVDFQVLAFIFAYL